MRSLCLLVAMLIGISPASAETRIIYLNKEGVTITPGSSDSRRNRSSLVKAPVSIPAWQPSDELWAETVDCVREMFAPFDVRFTEDDPGDIAHVEAVFGGSGPLLGLPLRAGGVSPFSPSCKPLESSIVFAFTDDLPADAEAICEVMAQEIAHSYGLDHVMLAADAMSYQSFAGRRGFVDELADCGETAARPCGVPGYASCRAQQNSYALLLERLGPARSAASDDDSALDDVGEPDAAAGCSAGAGTGWLVGLFLLAAARRRSNYLARV